MARNVTAELFIVKARAVVARNVTAELFILGVDLISSPQTIHHSSK